MSDFEKVLIVDDCEFLRRRLDKELRTHGYRVRTASDGMEALDILGQEPFDFVITDWDMPNLDGELLTRCIRADSPSERYLYLIMMTAHTESANIVSSFSAGVDDFVCKPINIPELLARMQAGARVLTRDRRLSYAADRDPLTGLLNRRSLASCVSNAAQQCTRTGRPVSCVLMDLDHFKEVNDTLGHGTGDEVLVAVADRLVNLFRNNDDVFRYGGEEFLIVLPETSAEQAEICAERCREAVSALGVHSFGVKGGITASFGVAEMNPANVSIVDLLERADLALLSAKKAGRNRTKVSDQTHVDPSELIIARTVTQS